MLVSKNIDEILVKKYNNKYSNIEFENIDIFHNRFLIIDRFCESSFKDLAKKCFVINEMESKELIDNLLSKIW